MTLKPVKIMEVLYDRYRLAIRRRHWADMPVGTIACRALWGLPGLLRPGSGKVIYWGIANPDPYTRLTRHGRPDAVSLTAPRPISTAIQRSRSIIETGKLVWYYQEFPGDDWDADINEERMLVRAPVRPDPKFVKWINSEIPKRSGPRHVVTVARAGVCWRSIGHGQFLGRFRSPSTTRTLFCPA